MTLPKLKKKHVTGLVVLVCIAVATLVAGFDVFHPTSNAHAAGLWTWQTAVPGTSTKPDGLTIRMAQISKVDTSRLGLVVRHSLSSDNLSLIAGVDGLGRTCFASAAKGAVTDFNCQWADDNSALLVRSEVGGPASGQLGYEIIVGIARADVERVRVSLADGTGVDLALNQWRAFSAAAERPNALPVSVSAYNAAGQTLQTVELHPGAPNY